MTGQYCVYVDICMKVSLVVSVEELALVQSHRQLVKSEKMTTGSLSYYCTCCLSQETEASVTNVQF